MKKNDPKTYSTSTRVLRDGHFRTAEGEHSEPIFATSSFVFNSANEAAMRFSGDEEGNIYSRFTNPTVRIFEQRLAILEGAERCVATASGMSAILTLFMSLLQAGDHIVASRSIFGTTVGLLENVLSKFGLRTTFVDLVDYDAWRDAIGSETKLLFLETPSNPLTEIVDIARLSEIAHAKNCLLVVDNCFCTPILQQPLRLGADVIIHSATKYLDGQGRCVGGAILGTNALLSEKVVGFLRTAGPALSPFNAWVFLKGLETLKIRMQAHCAGAMQVAQWLEKQARVQSVYYPGLASHAQHDLAQKQQSGFGGVVSFVVDGGRKGAWHVIDSMGLFSITANLGDTKSTITHSASTTHHRLTKEQRLAAGIQEGLIRLSIGFEDPQDLIDDLAVGLA